MSNSNARRYERELGRSLLAAVSRSFYLSLRALPGPVRGPMSLSYLLARASDTVADASDAVTDPAVRMDLLDRLGAAVEGVRDDAFTTEVAKMLGGGHEHDGEAELMRKLGDCLDWLDVLPPDVQEPIREVLRLIFRGQRLDLERFEMPFEKPNALKSREETDEYTYLVAGSVGEFWTVICGKLLRNPYTKSSEEMRTLAIEYGKGLQLLNIIRDFPGDLKTGRCYFPIGDRVREIDAGKLMPMARSALADCRHRLEAGKDYVAATRSVRLRFAGSLPLAIAFLTWEQLDGAGWDSLEKGVKVPRSRVKSLIKSLAWRSLRGKWINSYLERLAPASNSLPAAEGDAKSHHHSP